MSSFFQTSRASTVHSSKSRSKMSVSRSKTPISRSKTPDHSSIDIRGQTLSNADTESLKRVKQAEVE